MMRYAKQSVQPDQTSRTSKGVGFLLGLGARDFIIRNLITLHYGTGKIIQSPHGVLVDS